MLDQETRNKLLSVIDISDDLEERVRIGRTLAESRPDIYTPENYQTSLPWYRHVFETDDEELLHREWYLCRYYYYVYGAEGKDLVLWGFNKRPHEELKNYLTERKLLVLLKYLEDKSVIPFYRNKRKVGRLLKEYYRRDMMMVRGEQDLERFLKFAEEHPDFAVKPIDMACAQGVHKASAAGMTKEERTRLFEELVAEAQTVRGVYRNGNEDHLILEELIPQAEGMAVLHPQSLNIVRATMVRGADGESHMFYPWLAAARGGEFAANSSHDGLFAQVDAETGRVISEGATYHGDFDCHPDTGVRFEGFQIPRWDELCAMLREVTDKTRDIGYLGYDLALADDGWRIVEGNWRGTALCQYFLGHGVLDEFEELIGHEMEPGFWWQQASIYDC